LRNLKLTLAYDGTRFVGWQRQAEGDSVQGLLEDALARFEGAPVTVNGAGRTDAGVHALGQVANAQVTCAHDITTLIRALNAQLPDDVRVRSIEEMPPDFHARFNARSKTYRYRIWNGSVMSPFERAYVWHVPPPSLDTDAMGNAARLVEGRHDFAAFQATGTDPHSTERTIFSSRVVVEPDCRASRQARLITYEISGDGFLRHMVRTIAGTLVEVGRGRYASAWIAEVLASRSRARAGRTAPAEGLFLVKVDY